MATDQEIKSVALKLFAKKGYDAASLSEIAEGVGIKKPSIYAHFEGKEDLFINVFREVLRDYVDKISALTRNMEGETVEATLREILFGNCRYYMIRADEGSLIKRTMLFPSSDLAERMRAEFLSSEETTNRIFIKLFQEGIAAGSIRNEPIEELLASYYCLIDGLFIQMFYYNRDRFDMKMQSAWTIFWKGIRT